MHRELMKRELLKILRCPVCKGPLTVRVEKEADSEIVSGTLHCPACDENYPIVDGIPNLLPPDMR